MSPIGNQSRSKIGFADLYLERYGYNPLEALPEPDPDLYLIVVIPAFKEPDLADSILSLLECDLPGVKWEILVNINFPENSGPDILESSRISAEVVSRLGQELVRTDVRIHYLWNPDQPLRHAGVGLARKIAMDQALQRFNSIGRPDGVILSLDADSTCEKGYLKSVVDFYQKHPQARTANIYYEHPLTGGSDPALYRSIAPYELYLRYIRLAIDMTGHPHSIHTVGSSFSVRCRTYVRVNGMGRNKAGEDFYFLHKCILIKNFWEINDTAVRPSVRESDRVSFGTGASVHRLLSHQTLEVYSLDSFEPLRELFCRIGLYWRRLSCLTHSAGDKIPGDALESMESEWGAISEGLAEFLKIQLAGRRIQEMVRDSASEETFRDKFFAWFNGFMILKYLNFVHPGHFTKKDVMLEAKRLASALGIPAAGSTEHLLVQYRNFERSRGNRRII